EKANPLLAGVRDHILDPPALHQVPVRVDERVLPTHLRCEIDERVEAFGVLRAVALGPPAPGGPPGLHPADILDARRRRDIQDEVRLEDPSCGVSYLHDAPWQRPRERGRRLRLADTEALPGLRKSDAIRSAGRLRRQPRAAELAVEPG